MPPPSFDDRCPIQAIRTSCLRLQYVGAELGEQYANELPVGKTGMRDAEVGVVDPLPSEQQDVDVDLPRPPAIGRRTPDLLLDGLHGPQQVPGRPLPVNLQHLVQEGRLV